MLKEIAGALLVSTLTGVQPLRDNNSFSELVTETNNIVVTNYETQNLSLNNAGAPYDILQTGTKVNFKIESGNYNLLGCQYAYTYGYPTNLYTQKTADVDSGQNMNGQEFPKRPHSITLISLNNYKQFEYGEMEINLDFLTFDATYKRYFEVFTSKSSSVNNWIDTQNWMTLNKNYYKEIHDFCETDLYTTQLEIQTRTDNWLNINTDDTDLLMSSGMNYLIIFNYIYVESGSATGPTYWPITAGSVGQIDEVSYLEIQYSNVTVINQNIEVIDLPNLMFTILTMPFSFVSQAFNLTIFSGTPYAINISNLFLGILGVLVFVFLIKLLLAKAGQ